MDQNQLKALSIYAKRSFSDPKIPVELVIAYLDEESKQLGVTREEYLEYITVYGKLPV